MIHKAKALFPALALLFVLAHVAQSQSPPESIVLTGTIRDFAADGKDFETLDGTRMGAETGIVKNVIDTTTRKPIYNGDPITGTRTTNGLISFNRWYNDNSYTTTEDITLRDLDGNGVYTYENPSFFPIDGRLLGDSGSDEQGNRHNYHFTFELHAQFTFQSSLDAIFHFSGDDDVFVFINDKLALDMGGVHGRQDGKVDLKAKATELGLVDGQTYNFDFFLAERHTFQSNFILETSLVLRPLCDPKCVKKPKFCERKDVRMPAIVRKNGITATTARVAAA